ncbi:MAG: hypothetical protein ACLFTK_06625 [Anaerolineales bacterium]
MAEMTYCDNHPERRALENCEVCGKPLCGYCIYYTEDGQRLCETHAHTARENDIVVYPPAVYADGIIPAQANASRQIDDLFPMPKGVVESNRALYRGNNTDLNAFLGMLIGLLSLATCCGAVYCMPFLAILLGALALSNAKDAVEPRRTRQHAWIAILTGGVFVGFILACIGFYVVIYAGTVASFNTANFNTNATFVFPTQPLTSVPPSPTVPVLGSSPTPAPDAFNAPPANTAKSTAALAEATPQPPTPHAADTR